MALLVEYWLKGFFYIFSCWCQNKIEKSVSSVTNYILCHSFPRLKFCQTNFVVLFV